MIWGKETPYDRLGYTVSTQIIALVCENLFDKFSKDNDDNDDSAQPRAAITGNQR